jgi:polyisoprenyl-teichoic acid--peptidoglycan teichoic acid transferase
MTGRANTPLPVRPPDAGERPKTPRRSLRRAVPWVLLAACVLAVVSIVGFSVLFPYSTVARPVTGALHGVAPESFLGTGPQRVLLLGVDARGEERSRSDTIVLAKVSDRGFGLLSIPRDTRTEVPGHGQDKINHAFAYGGPELARQSVENLTGVDTPHHVVVKMEGVKEIVDALGGVRVDVPRPMTGKVPGEEREISLQPGPQTLNGDEALMYVRWRWDGSGDIGRVARQQDFLVGVVGQALAPSRLAELPALRRVVLENVETNMSLPELLQFAGRVRALEDAGAPQTVATVPGEAAMLHSPQAGADLSFWVPDPQGLREAVGETIR